MRTLVSLLPAIVTIASNVVAAPQDFDATFGSSGIATGTGPLGLVTKVVLQPDGKIIALSAGSQLRSGLWRLSADGTPDATFGAGTGIVDLTPLCSLCPTFAALSVQPDGKIVVAAGSPLRVARFTPAGQLDSSFGAQGLATSSPTFTEVEALAILANGDIVVAGRSLPATALDSGPSLVALHTDGSLDTAFGQGGQVDPAPGFYGRYSAIAVQVDGKIVAAGEQYSSTGVFMLAARFFPNGQPDTTFGAGGMVVNPAPFAGYTVAFATAIQTDGRILLAGAAEGNDGIWSGRLLRLNSDGTVDATFGSGGSALVAFAVGVTEFQANEQAFAVLVQPDNRIVLVGNVTRLVEQLHGAAFNRIGIARFNVDGSHDTSFAGGGSATIWTAFGAGVYDAVLRADGRIAMGGDVELSPPISANDPFEPGRYVNLRSPAVVQILGGTSAHPSPLHQAAAVEYYDATFNHYFVTAMPFEIATLDTSTQSQSWSRTGRAFEVVTGPGAEDSQIVCRFFSGQAFAPKSSHFYTPYPLECAAVQQNLNWIYEGGVFFLDLPVGTPGSRTCPGDDTPQYRLYNNGQGGAPNHRYTNDLVVYNAMIAQGWVPEGEALTKVFACLPAQ